MTGADAVWGLATVVVGMIVVLGAVVVALGIIREAGR